MIKSIFTRIFLSSIFFISLAFSDISTKTVDVEKSTITWVGSKLTGSSHQGTIKLKSGNLLFENNSFSGGEFVMDMSSINTTDLKGSKKAKLEKHLKSDDFFGIQKHTEASFVITKVILADENGSYNITGNLTIKGVSKESTFKVKLSESELTGKLTIDRSLFNIRYGSGSFFENLGNRAISNDFTLDLQLVFL